MISEKEKIISIPKPAILHLKWDGHEHYVVLYKIKNNKAYINDLGMGRATENLESLLKNDQELHFCYFQQVVLKKEMIKKFFSRFLVLLKPYKKYIIETFIASIFLSLFGLTAGTTDWIMNHSSKYKRSFALNRENC